MIKDAQIKKVQINEAREIIVTFKAKQEDWNETDFSTLAAAKITGATIDFDFKLNGQD